MSAAPDVAGSLKRVRTLLADAAFDLETEDAERQREAVRSIVQQIDDYLLPRLEALDAPLLAVVGGSTGAGKSTLINSVLGQEVSTAGVLRPTTRLPVLVCAEADRDWFSGARVLPALARVTGEQGEGSGMRVVTAAGMPPGLALIDAPDVDSVVEANRELAARLLDAADLWVFVTTAARYADAVPWELLRVAQQRKTALAIVLNRVPPEAVDEVGDDLRRMLASAGLDGLRLFVIQESQLADGRLPEDAIGAVREWLRSLALDAEARNEVVRQTLAGALDSIDGRVAEVTAGLARQSTIADQLRVAAAGAYERAGNDFAQGVRSGTMLRGEVLARWQDFVGTGEWMRSLESRVGRIRDRITAAIRGRPTPVEELQGAIESNVETLLRAAADQAAESTVLAWRSIPGGTHLLRERQRELEHASAGFAEAAAREVLDWQGYVLELVRSEGAGRRSTARFLSFGVNGAGLVVMLAVFASTGGITGGEVVVAGGTTAISQKVLEAVFGDAAVRSLAARAREDLEQRAARLLSEDRARFDVLVDEAAPPASLTGALRAGITDLAAARQSQARR